MDTDAVYSDRHVQLVLGTMFFVVLCDAVKTLAGIWRVHCAKNAEGVSVSKVLLNIGASAYGLAAEGMKITAATALSITWLAPVAQTVFGVLCNVALFFVLAWYVQPADVRGYADPPPPDPDKDSGYADPQTRTKRVLADARVYATGLVMQIALFILCLSAGVAAYIFCPLLFDAAASVMPDLNALPPLYIVFAVIGVVMSFVGSCAQVYTTLTTRRPETQHWLYAVVPAVAPLFLAAVQFITDVSWAIWFASLVPFVPELVNVFVLFFRMRHRVHEMFLMDAVTGGKVAPRGEIPPDTDTDSLVELNDLTPRAATDA
jgi:hypothetical protein